LTDRERGRALGERSLERARMFSWERTARETVDAYEAAARSGADA